LTGIYNLAAESIWFSRLLHFPNRPRDTSLPLAWVEFALFARRYFACGAGSTKNGQKAHFRTVSRFSDKKAAFPAIREKPLA
jgi:hypothetical protein